MPKLIVLFFGEEDSAPTLANAVAEGAKGVRFTEVEVRPGARAVGGYDAVVIAAAGEAIGAELGALLGELERGPRVPNTVFAAASENDALLARLARVGGIVVTERGGSDPLEAARALGGRVAKVSGWVRHGLGHEADAHHASHGHSHDHHH